MVVLEYSSHKCSGFEQFTLYTRASVGFYVQIKNEEEITMLVIPPAFRTVIKKWQSSTLLVLSASANKWWEF